MESIVAQRAIVPWPPDDTKTSILRTDQHQRDAYILRRGTNEEALHVAAGGSLPWQAVTQVMFLGCERPDGSRFVVYFDVMVFSRAMSRERGSYSLRQDGPPVLIIEVASEATVESDLDLERGKGWSYAHAGVREYLVLDPTRQFIPEGGTCLPGSHPQPHRNLNRPAQE